MTDLRRRGAGIYHLTINGELWSEVEWSASRQSRCIQDAAGNCLTHVEHVVGQDRDAAAAVRLAKKMIVSGEMPTPEEAQQQLEREQQRERLGEPFAMPPERVAAEREPTNSQRKEKP
jgi:hypothetical protein